MTLPYRFNPLGLTQWVPVSGTRGVFITSGATVIQSAMTITGGTIGTDYPGNRMDVYSRGRAVDTVISSDGHMYVSNGGIATSATVNSDGIVTISSGGEIVNPGVVTGGTISISSGGVLSGGVISSWNGAFIYVSSGGVSYDTETQGIQFQVRDGGAAYRPVIRNGQIQLRGSVYDFVMSGGIISAYQGIGGIISGGTIHSGGLLLFGSRVASDVVIVGGNGYIAVRGGTIVNPVISATGSLMVSSGGIASNFSSVEGATVNILSGGSATIRGATAYGVSVESGGALTVESGGVLNVQSGKTVYGVTADDGASVVVNDGGLVHIQVGKTVYGVTVESGGSARTSANCSCYNMVISSGATVAVTGRGIVSGTNLYGSMNVYGNVNDTDVKSGGRMALWTNASAMVATVSGSVNVLSSILKDATIVSGGAINISGGGIASNFTSVDGATVVVSSGGSATTAGSAYGVSVAEGGALTVESGGVLNIQSGKTAYGVTVSGGTALVRDGGEIIGGIARAGIINVYAGGSALNTTTIGAGFLNVFSGYASGVDNRWATFVNGGTVADVFHGANAFDVRWGSASHVVMSGAGRMDVGNYNPAAEVTDVVVSKGYVRIFRNGSVNDAVVISGGSIFVNSGGTTSAPTILNGGTMTVSSGGSALEVVAEPDAVINSQTGATVEYAQPSAGVQGVFTSSGTTAVASAMVVSGGTIGDGYDANTMKVNSRGRALDVTVDSGGSAFVGNGGTMLGFMILENGRVNANAGGIAVSGVIDNAGDNGLFVYGSAHGNTLSNGKIYIQLGGKATETTISGGNMYIYSGSAELTTIRGGQLRVSSGTKATSTTISSGGSMTIYSGGSADITTVSSGGRMTVLSGGSAIGASALHAIIDVNGTLRDVYAASGTINAGNGIYIRFGGMASGVVVDNLGSTYVASAGVASDVTVSSGGLLLVSSGGAAFDVTSSTGADIIVLEGGTITYK